MRRLLCILLIVFTGISSLHAQEDQKWEKKTINLIYEKGCLVNQGSEDILNLEIISPFYRYLGEIPKESKVNVSDIKTKFTVQYTSRKWLGGVETMKKTFIPEYEAAGLEHGLKVITKINKDLLNVKVSSPEEVKDIFVEILLDIPIKISEDRVRYTLSSVGVKGQNLKTGPDASFSLYLINDQPFYKVPVNISYVYNGLIHERVFFFSFTKEEFNSEVPAP